LIIICLAELQRQIQLPHCLRLLLHQKSFFDQRQYCLNLWLLESVLYDQWQYYYFHYIWKKRTVHCSIRTYCGKNKVLYPIVVLSEPVVLKFIAFQLQCCCLLLY
jgi:hypothetical protein